MESIYDVGIANRYALFLEEGENSLTDIKKKVSKERRAKNKQVKKENAEAKKIEAVKAAEKPKKPETKVVAEEFVQNVREIKIGIPKNKEKISRESETSKREKEPQDKPKNIRNCESSPPVVDSWDSEFIDMNDSASAAPVPRKIYENRDHKPHGERKFDNNDQFSPRNFSNQRRFKSKDDPPKNEASNADAIVNGGDEWNAGESGHESQNNEHKRRGGDRYRGEGRGGRNLGDREPRRYNNERYYKNKENADTIKTDSWGAEEKEEHAPIENSDNQTEEVKVENDANWNNELKEEVKELLTLDEWKKMRGEREKPHYNLRKAGEGEDLSQWKNMRELQKEQVKEFLENGYNYQTGKKIENDKENTSNENVQRVARQRHLELDFHFREPATRGRRGGRTMRNNKFGLGGFRGKYDDRNGGYGGEARSFRRNRDGPPSFGRGAARQNAPRITDERDFPTLG